MTMGVHEPRYDDRVGSVDHLDLRRRLHLCCHRHDLLALDQDISFYEVAHFRIHADHGSALQEDVLARRHVLPPDTLQCPHIAGILRTLCGSSLACQLRDHSGNGKRRAFLDKTAPGEDF